MAKSNPAEFVQEVRAEAVKVAWPTRREVMLTTVMVFIMATIAALFFFFIDRLISFGLEQILQFGA
ncbi:preprotein translocase subunit SecE [Monaibacterium marinum]|uniref:Protein translocase subunit SecE n=1 Tax=Pontivivens marinum TaxID=1690039 RepID=A0A2C9CU40_9RHOB|nr:preprotein translocase subunit SecE [Monaibacterium marinum]SOH94645.1 preprotein translocase subunit SecE [Monaibacterium marinum]